MNWFLLLLKLSPEIRELVVEVVRLLQEGKREEAAEVVRSRELGNLAGRAASRASRRAGR